jgi:beta-D-xylosidase 4
VPSEDPLLNGDFGSGYTQGLQQGVDSKFLQAVVTLKHWDAYSLEDAGGFTRHNFDARVSSYALAHTYFPAFRKSVVEGGATGVMCSVSFRAAPPKPGIARITAMYEKQHPLPPSPQYNSLNGVPTCASSFLTEVLRNKWGFKGVRRGPQPSTHPREKKKNVAAERLTPPSPPRST